MHLLSIKNYYLTTALENNSDDSYSVAVPFADVNQAGGANGAMFDVTAKTNITITQLQIHTSSKKHENIEVWSRDGSYVNYENDSSGWYMNAFVNIKCEGNGVYIVVSQRSCAS